jgi:hypothetical protein
LKPFQKMPKINTKVNTRDQQQRLRRMRQREADFEEKLSINCNNCVSLDKLYGASKAELMALIPIIKKIIQHNEKTAVLISERVYNPPEISTDEYNTELYDYLKESYKGHKGKTLKYTYCHQKDRFRQTIIVENQLQINNCLPITVENTIKKLFNNIDISDYKISETYLRNEKKARETQRETQPETQPEIIIPEAPLPPTPTPEMLTPHKPPKKKASVPAAPKKPKGYRNYTTKKKAAAPPAPADESDSDIEGDIKELEIRDITDQDTNTPEDLKQWRNKISKLWKDEIEDHFNNIEDDEDDYEEYSKGVSINSDTKRINNRLREKYENQIPSLVHLYINRTKTQTRGSKLDIGTWAGRNPVILKKMITSIVVKAQKKILKENL